MAIPTSVGMNCDSGTVTAPTLPPATPEHDGKPHGRAPLGSRLRDAGRTSARTLGRLRRPVSVRQPWLNGLIGALWAAFIGFGLAALPMLAMWMSAPDSGLTWTEALRLAGLLWVASQGAAVTIAGVTVTLIPWGLAVIPLLLLGYAGGWAARRSDVDSPRSGAQLVLAGAIAYAAVAGVLAVLTSRSAASVSVPAALGCAFVLALVGLGFGTFRASRGDWLGSVPTLLLVVLRAGAVGALALLGLGTVAASVSLMLHIDDAVTMAQSLAGGLGGGLGLLALGVAYVPVMAMWGTAYVMGAGVVVGPAVTISPFVAVTAPTDLPPFPLLAALPQGATPLAWALPLTGVAAGVLAGLVIARRARRESRLVRLALATGAAAVAGVLLALGAFLASGSLGDLRLAFLGPVPATVGILGAVLIVLGAAPSAAAAASSDRRRLSVANVDADGPEASSVIVDTP